MRKRSKKTRVDVELPVRPVAFAVLAALADGARPGIEILERVNASVPSRPLLGPGTLYRLLRELRQSGWIERTAVPRGVEGGDDERRQYHALTSLGRRVLHGEAERLRRTMQSAGLLGAEGA